MQDYLLPLVFKVALYPSVSIPVELCRATAPSSIPGFRRRQVSWWELGPLSVPAPAVHHLLGVAALCYWFRSSLLNCSVLLCLFVVAKHWTAQAEVRAAAFLSPASLNFSCMCAAYLQVLWETFFQFISALTFCSCKILLPSLSHYAAPVPQPTPHPAFPWSRVLLCCLERGDAALPLVQRCFQ